MAIPFVVSSDEKLDQLFVRLYEILQQIYHLSQQTSSGQAPSTPNVRCPVNSIRRFREDTIESNYPSGLPDIVNNLALLPSPAGQYLEDETVLQPRAASSPRRRKRRRTNSKSASSDINKSSDTVSVDNESHQVWTQVGVPLLKMATDFDPSHQPFICKETRNVEETTDFKESPCQESIFSKLVPDISSKSIWTAVICVVGWHLLRTR